jgi:hypothetical protein
MRTGKYSPQEDKSIIELRSKGKGNYEIAVTLNRNLDSVKGRIKALLKANSLVPRTVNETRGTKGKSMHRWDENEINILKNLRAKGELNSAIAKKLDRSIDSIQQMCIRLKKDNEVTSRNPPKDEKIYNLDSEISLIGLMLWWAEGTKKGRNVQFVNSSPDMIKIYMIFLNSIGVDLKKLSAKIKVMNQSQVDPTQKYWSRITGISMKNFTKPIVRGKPVDTKDKDHKGCLTITYCSINLKRQMEKRIEEINQRILKNYLT